MPQSQKFSGVIKTARAAPEYSTSYYANGGQPSGILRTESDLAGEITVTGEDGTTRVISKKDRIREEWEKRHNGPMNAQRIAVLDMGLDYKPLSISNGTILGVRAGRNYAALLFKNPGADRDERFILIIDKNMHSVNQLSFKDSEVVAFDFLDAGSTELLWVSTMDVGQFTEESIVRIYDCGSGGSMIHYTSPFYNQAIYNLYLSDRCLFMVGTQSIIRYDRDGDGFSAERDRVRVYGSTIVDFYAGTETAYFIALPVAAEGEENSLVRLITISETDDLWSNVMQKYMPSPVVGAFLFNGSICVFTRENFLQYSFAGKKLLDLEPQVAPVEAFRYGADGFFVVTGQNCYRATLE